MRNTRRGYEFSVPTKELALERQHHQCAGCSAKSGLTAHHAVPIFYAKRHLRNCQEVKKYISGENNCIYLCESCHSKQHEHEDYKAYKLLSQYMIGINYLLNGGDYDGEAEASREREIIFQSKTRETGKKRKARKSKKGKSKSKKSKKANSRTPRDERLLKRVYESKRYTDDFNASKGKKHNRKYQGEVIFSGEKIDPIVYLRAEERKAGD
jgi:hypothetical protein